MGLADDVKAVKNAFNAYKEIDNINPFSIAYLLNVHKAMMEGLVEESGEFRTRNVGVFDDEGNAVHTALPYNMVETFINQLFNWVKFADV